MRPRDHPKIIILIIFLILGLFGLSLSGAVKGATGVPKIIQFQGRLLDVNSNLLGGSAGTSYCFRFSVYDNATVGAGTKLWPAGTPSGMKVTTTSGVFNVGVGDTVAGGDALSYNFQDNNTVYLNVEVATLVGATCAAGDGAESWENVSPRQQIVSSGYAINASTLLGLTPYEYASSTEILVLSGGNLNLGGTNPQINATGSQVLTFQGNGGTGNIQFFSASNTLTSSGALTVAGAITAGNGLTLSTGALNLTSTSGLVALTLSSSTTAFNVNNQLVVDTTNNRVGIGTTSPSTTLHVVSSNAIPVIKFESTFGANSEPRLDIIGQDASATQLWFSAGVKGGGSQNTFSGATSAHDYELRTNNLPRVTIKAGTGNVGIGTTVPSTTLHVIGTGRFSSALTLDNGLTLTTGALTLTATSGSANLTLSSSTTAFNVNNFFDVDTTNNRVGIGTASPSTTLHVIGAITGTSLNASSATLSGLTSGSLLFAGTGGAVSQSSTTLYWDNVNGRLGVGTNSPSSTLDVRGNVVLSSGAKISPLTDATAGLKISTATGTDYVYFDTTNARVGIGGITPSTTLDVVGTGRFSSTLTALNGLTLTTGALTLTATSGSASLTLSSSTTAFNVNNQLVVDTTNNRVGIGTTSPDEKLQVAGDIHFTNTRTRTMTRTIPTTVGNEVDIGAFTMTASLYFEVWVTVPSSGYAQSKRYFLPAPYNATVGAWQTVVPISTTGAYGGNDTDLEININSLTTTLRLRRVGGTTAGTAYITILQQGVDTDPFAASTATSTVTAPTSTYTHTLITQLSGNVGIGTTAPAVTLDVVGSGRINTTSTTAFQIQSSSTGFTFDSLNNRLGIGTAAPESTLQVGSPFAGTTGVMPLIRFIGTVQSSTEATILRLNRGVNVGLHYAGSADFKMKAYSDATTAPFTQLTLALKSTADLVETANIDVITFRDTGNVGIGTTSPSTTLHVIGTITGTSLNASSAVLSGLTQGSIHFTGSGGAVSESSTVLYWDNTNGRLGVGTNAPSTTLDVIGSGRFNATSTTAFQIQSSSTGLTFDSLNNRLGIGTAAPSTTLHVAGNITLSNGSDIRPLTDSPNALKIANGNAGLPFAFFDSTNGRLGLGFGAISPSSTLHVSGTALFKPGTDSTTAFQIQPSSSTTPVLNIDSINARVGIGNNSPGVTFDVTGTGRFSSTLTASNGLTLTTGALTLTATSGSANLTLTSSTTAFNVNNQLVVDTTNNRVGIGTTAPSTTLDVRGNVVLLGGASIAPLTDSTASLKFQTATGTNFIQLDSVNGRVGIGDRFVTTPSTTLDVRGTVRASAGLTLTTGAISLTATSGAINLTLTSSTQAFKVNNQLDIDTTNNRVGIGTVSPSTTLTVQGNISLLGDSDIRPLTDSPNALKIANGNAGLPFAFFDSTNGRLGLGFGATSPSSTLHVSGTATITGLVSVGLGSTGSVTAVCSSLASATAPTANTAYELRDCNNTPVADYMEMYPTESDVQSGDIVITGSSYATTQTGDELIKLAKSSGPYQSTIIGIVSSPENAGDFNSIGYNINKEDHPLPVALNGRVKVKVSRENGPIEAGDFVTTSSIPGVGMKAAKAGLVIGRALSSYDGANVATIMVFVSNGYFNGKSVTSALPGISGVNQPLGVSSINLGKQILLQLITHRGEISSGLKLSEITTDRLTAGLEVITPRVVTRELVVDSLEVASGGDIALNLDKGKFVIKHRDLNNESSTEAVVSIDSAGNALFAGEVKAGSITADRISGLEVITNKISLLNNKVESLAADQSSTLSANNLEVNGSASILGSLKALKIISNEIESPTLITLKNGLTELASSTEGIKIEAASTTERVSRLTNDLGELGKRLTAVEESQVALSNILGKDKGTEISGVSILKGGLQVNKISAADNEIAFMSDAVFFGRPYFTADTAGFGVILQGQKEVKVTFEKEYIEKPVVSATISLDEAIANLNLEEMILNGDLRYIVTRVSAKGFTILINKSAPANIQFSWTALAVKNPKTFFSLKEAEPPITPLAKPTAPTSSQALSGSGSSTQARAVSSSTEPVITPPKSSSTEPVITPPESLSGTPPPPTKATSTVEAPPAQAKPSSIEASPPPVIEAPSSSAPSEPAPASSGTPRG